MPAPAKISPDSLRAAAHTLVESDGAPALTMQAVAAQLGVRAPSLYKHVRDRNALLELVRNDALDALATALRQSEFPDAAHRLRAQAHATREFAKSRPNAFTLVFSSAPLDPVDPARLQASVAPLRDTCAELVGEDQALDAARTVTSWLVGFVAMEQASAFQLGGDVDRAFAYGLDTILAGLRAA